MISLSVHINKFHEFEIFSEKVWVVHIWVQFIKTFKEVHDLTVAKWYQVLSEGVKGKLYAMLSKVTTILFVTALYKT